MFLKKKKKFASGFAWTNSNIFFSNIAFLIIKDSLFNKNVYWQIFSLYGDKTTLIGNVMSFKQSFPLILLKNMNVLYEQHSVEYSFILTRNLLAAHVLLKIRGILLWNRNVRPLKLPVKYAIFYSLYHRLAFEGFSLCIFPYFSPSTFAQNVRISLSEKVEGRIYHLSATVGYIFVFSSNFISVNRKAIHISFIIWIQKPVFNFF